MISPELQETAIEAYCAPRGYEIVEAIRDIDLSGRFWSRRQVERAITMIEFGAADVLVVARWSRVARNRHDWAIAVDRIESVGGRLESALEPVDVTTSTGRFARGLLAEFAAFEAERYSDMWQEVCRRRLAQGLPSDYMQRFGYIREAGGTYVPDPVIGPLIATAYRRYARGASAASIARWLNKTIPLPSDGPYAAHAAFSSSKLLRLLDRGFGAGVLWTKDGWRQGVHPPVISRRMWESYLRARAQRAQPKSVHVDVDRVLMHGLVFCYCGNAMSTCERAGKGYTFVCSRGAHGSSQLNHCGVRANIVDASVHRWLSNLAEEAAGTEARHHSQAVCERRWQHARELARQMDESVSKAERDALVQVEDAAMWFDPAQRATDLIADWPDMNMDTKRRRLLHLVGRVEIRSATPPQKDRVTVLGWWETSSSPSVNADHAADDVPRVDRAGVT